MTPDVWVGITTVFGLIVGSFLNVVINRLHTGKSFLGGRSHCPHCKHELGVLDLIPVLSFFFLRGKCKYCKKPISWQYPAIELITAIAYGLLAYQYFYSGLSVAFSLEFFAFLLGLVLAATFIVIAVYDIKHYLILDKVVFPAVAVAIIYAALKGELVSGLFGVLTVSGFFLAQYLASKGTWIGFGDVKFGLLLGMVAGFPGALILLFMSYLLGAVTGVTLIGFGKKDMGSILPFGAFLSASAVICMMYGDKIANWYADIIGINTWFY